MACRLGLAAEVYRQRRTSLVVKVLKRLNKTSGDTGYAHLT